MSSEKAAPAAVIITPRKTSLNYFTEVWQNRDLLRAFTIRDLKLRYKQTILGIAWVILQPLLGTLIFTIVFGGVFSLQDQTSLAADQVPYALFVFSGLVFWNFFSDSVNFGANSLLSLADVIKKVYFPRLIAPIATILVALVNFLINLIILLLITLIFFRANFQPQFFLFLPLLIFAEMIISAGLAFLFSALNLKYRDIKHALPFLIQLLLFLSPVIYPSSILPARVAWLAYLNPMTAIINTVRSLLFSAPLPYFFDYLLSFIAALLIFLIGLFYFRRTEKYFADIA